MIKLSEHFSYLKLRRFTFPSIFMLIFTSAYGIVDGFFVSNFVGKIEFTALNFIMPFLMLLGCFGFLFGTGGGALIAKTIGEGDRIKANQIFSMLVYLSIFCGIVFGIAGYFLLPIVSSKLGAAGDLLDLSVRYGRILMFAIPMFTSSGRKTKARILYHGCRGSYKHDFRCSLDSRIRFGT